MTPRDLISLALKQAGVVGVGQTPLAEDINDSFALLNMMLGQWNRRRWLVYHLRDVSFQASGALSYTIGPGGDIPYPQRPDRIEAAFVRRSYTAGGGGGGGTPPVTINQSDFNADFGADFGPPPLVIPGTPGVVNPGYMVSTDYPLTLIQSYEDYASIPFKSLGQNTLGFPQAVFLDSDFPLGKVYVWPIPDASFEVHLILKEELGGFPDLSSPIQLPNEYQEAVFYNLVVRLGPAYSRQVDAITQGLAKAALQTIRTANAQIPLLSLPDTLARRTGVYNVYSDSYTG